jgi:hypothetical protein
MPDSIDSSNSLYPLPSPPPLAPGPSLLDDSDTRFLDSFFDGVSSDQYLLNDQTDSWSYEWQDLPPDFLGTTSSFGQQIEPVTNDIQHLTFPEYKNPLGFVPDPDTSSPSEDVLAAATLLRDSQHSNTFMTPVSQAQSMDLRFSQSMTATEPTQSRKMPMKPEDYLRHTSISEAIYGPSFSTFSPSRSLSRKVEIKWGTDSGFANGRGFVAPPNSLTVDEIEESMVNTLGCFQPGSNASTRPSSPVGLKMQPYDRRLERISETANVDSDDNDDRDARSKKRKKVKTKEEEYEDEDDNRATSKIPRKRRPKSFSTAADSHINEAAPQKRRKSAASAAPKMTRENLTEDQKRENHIRSEQKRRTLIKEGFEDLNELVPDLRGGGFSKSAVLIMAADWLEDLISCNKNLKAQLAELEHRHGI